MGRKSSASRTNYGDGSVFFRTDRKKWVAQYYDKDPVTLKTISKRKQFDTEEEAKAYIRTKMYQKENPLYIKNHGIPLIEIMKSNLQTKYDTNMISGSQYERVSRTLKCTSTMVGAPNLLNYLK